MKDKKGGGMLVMVAGLIVLALLILFMLTSGNQWFNSVSDSVDDNIMTKLNLVDKSNDNLDPEDKFEKLGDARFDGRLTDDQINYGLNVVKYMFNISHSDSTNGVLMTFLAPTSSTIELENSFFLLSTSSGVVAGYNDQNTGNVLRLVTSKSSGFKFLEGTDICILPFDNNDHSAKKVLSYATGFKQNGVESLPTKEEVMEIMSSHVVDQISISTTRLKYFMGTNVISRNTMKTEILGYDLNGITCLFPVRDGPSLVGVRLPSWGDVVLKGSGRITMGLTDSLISEGVKIKQGDFS